MTAESDWSPSESRAHISKPQYLITSNAFYPIKDDIVADKNGDQKVTDAIIRPLVERIAALEKSRKALEDDVQLQRRREDERKPKKEDLMRSNTDLITHLSYKMQVLAESVATLKGKVQGVEDRTGDQQSSVRDLEKKLSNIDNTVLSAQDELLGKQSNELLMMRDVIAELRSKVDLQQRPKKEDHDLASEVSSFQRVIDGIRAKQDSTERELEKLRRKQEKDADQEDWIRQLVDERCQRILQKEDVDGKLNQLAKALSEERAARQELQQKLKDAIDKNWEDHKTERQDETKKLRELVKSDKARTNASLHKLNDAVINVMEKQMEEQKVSQEKLQAEIIARQQFECEALQKLIDLDEKTARLSKHVNELNGTTHKVREELRGELEAQETARKKAVKDLESKVIGKKKAIPSDDDSDWKERTDLAIAQLRKEVRHIHDTSKDRETDALANSKKMEEMAANIKRINGELAEIENFKNDTSTSLDAVDKKIKNANKKRPVVAEPNDGATDANQEQLKTIKEKLKKDGDQLRLLKKEVEACARKEDLEKLRQEWTKNADNNDNEKAQNEKIRTLANAIQMTKGVVAMKMQHEEKMRVEIADHLQGQIDSLEKTIEEIRRREDDQDEEEEVQSADGTDAKKDREEDGQRDNERDRDRGGDDGGGDGRGRDEETGKEDGDDRLGGRGKTSREDNDSISGKRDKDDRKAGGKGTTGKKKDGRKSSIPKNDD